MSSQRDPGEVLVEHLNEIADLSNVRVVDIGCGNGHLTFRYAATARRVVGVDTNAERLSSALRDRPPTLHNRAHFAQAHAEVLPFPSASFDAAILSWSL